MKIRITPAALLLTMFCMNAVAQAEVTASDSPQSNAASPLVLGHGVGLFKVGPLLAQDDFEDLDNWVVQIQQRTGFAAAKVATSGSSLNCLVPGRGCTVWFKKKFPTRVTIVYNVLCPTPKPAIKGVQGPEGWRCLGQLKSSEVYWFQNRWRL